MIVITYPGEEPMVIPSRQGMTVTITVPTGQVTSVVQEGRTQTISFLPQLSRELLAE